MALERYSRKLLFDDVGPESKDDAHRGRRKKVGQLKTAEVVGLQNFHCGIVPGPDMDEAYNLTVSRIGTSFKLVLTARSGWGLLRALETLSQLIFNIKPEPGQAEDVATFAINIVDIQDEPRFKHRGFMLDTARHYIPVETILQMLDAMSFNKLNVFHWHIIDDQSFPLASETFPELSKSAFKPDMVYTRQDVQIIILYAALRGIRVIPELDSPGHTYSMRQIPDLLSECYDSKTARSNGDFGPINPTKDSTYKTINDLIIEFKSQFSDPYFFAGGDEVDFDCWKSNPQINSWMKARNMSGNYEELTNHYMRQLYETLKYHEKTMVVWQEVFDMGAKLPLDTIVSVWKYINDTPAYMAQLASVVEQGYQAILSSCWYLNYIDYGQDWIKFYACDPRSSPIERKHEHLIIGGEICMWTEFVDHTNVMSRTWPRASAAAERLWSPKEANDVEEFLHRLEQHRCRLLYRGINAEPVNGPGYC